jgi:ABC-2 type transport system ATP-binding protein
MIEASDLKKCYGSTVALDSVSFRVSKGEVVGFLGPNGAGKSTCMKILTGFLSPSGGTGRIADLPIDACDESFQNALGYLPEHAPLYPEMSVGAFLTFVATMRNIGRTKIQTRINQVAEKCGLEDVQQKLIGTLSKGYRQRVGIAQAVIHDPQVLILDEPTSGLDPNQIEDVRKLIRGFGQEKTILFSSHVLTEVSAVADRIIILDRGHIVANDTPANLIERMSGNTVRLTIRDGSSNDLVQWARSLPFVTSAKEVLVPHESGAAHIGLFHKTDISDLARMAIESGFQLTELAPEKENLESVFQAMTGGRN